MWHKVIGSVLLFPLVSCGSSTVRAAATRVLDTDSNALQSTPVCFLPPPSNLGLTEKAASKQVLEICEQAAQKQQVRVVPWGSEACLVATLTFQSSETGVRETDCAYYSINCKSNAVHQKSVKVSLSTPARDKTIAETTAAIKSDFKGFSKETYFALCSAAFYEFPKAFQNEQLDAPVE